MAESSLIHLNGGTKRRKKEFRRELHLSTVTSKMNQLPNNLHFD